MGGEWSSSALGCIADFISGGTPSKDHSLYWGGSVPWVSAKDMKRFRLDDTQDHVTDDGVTHGTKLVPSGTVLILTRGMTLLNDVPICVAGRPTTFNQDVKAIRSKSNVREDFLPYLLLGNKERLLSLVDLAGHGTGRLNTDELKSLDVTLPPEPEQRAIAHILGSLDDKIEANRRMNETLEAMARALFKSWFVDFDPVRAKAEGQDTGLPQHLADLFPDRLVDSELGEIPEGWAVSSLGNLSHNPQYGFTASAISKPVGPKFLRITDINKTPWISWRSVPYCRVTSAEYEKYHLREGDILVARMADPGHGVFIESAPEAVFASYLIRFRPKCGGYGRYLQYWLRSDSYWELVKGRAAGTTRFSLNAKVLCNFPLVIPSRPVADVFTRQIEGLRRRLVASTSEAEQLVQLRDALLPKLISGELRITDPERFLERVLQEPHAELKPQAAPAPA